MIARLKRILLALALVPGLAASASAKDVSLLNVSYDPTRELYVAINAAFAKEWQAKTGDTVIVQQSHGGSSKQARAVIDGLEADVVTLALAGDIDALAEKAQLLPADWQSRLPQNSTPYTSTIVFLVRKGNPKQIHDWNDLIKPGVSIISPSPKTSGGGQWNFLAAWGYALKQGGSEEKAKDYVTEFYRHVPVLDSGARGATTTFVQRGLGDVLVAWENEAYLSLKEFGPDKFEIVTPSLSILAEPPVAWVDKEVDRHGTRKVAEAYLRFLYTPEAQEIIGQNFYRPRDAKAAAKYASQFAPVKLFTIDETVGGWKKAKPKFFNDGGLFDQIYQPTGAAPAGPGR
jgi:sulfate/thiosulfate-binding protein